MQPNNPTTEQPERVKSVRALAEETVLAFWKQHDIFTKTNQKAAPNGEYVFFEGPPTANAKPALHHLAARAFKDVIPRYKTMQGFHVRRRAGWDTHGLPVELQIEKKLGLQSKKEIEQFGVAAFNKECKDSVFTYIKEWESFTERIGYWVDDKNAYYTFDATFMESLWYIIGQVDQQGLLYKDYKVVPWCPRCGTGLSSHELAQGYEDVKELSVYAQFKLVQDGAIVTDDNTYIIAWTTTPWTLPGNVALAVGKDIVYVKVKVTAVDGSVPEKSVIVAKDRMVALENPAYTLEVVSEMTGADLVGRAYEPLYPYLKDILSAKKDGDDQKEKLSHAFNIVDADFVTTTDGTGVVHIAPMYGADDFVLGTKKLLPKFHTVDESGHFIAGTDFLEGRFAKDETVAVDIIKDLAHRGLLWKKEKYEHSYPHCWRCKTALLYYARDSWYIAMEKLRDVLVSENDTINWEPSHIKEGRFGAWIREVKDWAISRERYWGTPLPIWVAPDGEKIVVNSIATLKQYAQKSNNTYVVMRHGQTENNVAMRWNCNKDIADPLTEEGKSGVQASAQQLAEQYGAFDLVVVSPFPRTEETANIVAQTVGLAKEAIVVDERLVEWNVGAQYDAKPFMEFFAVRNTAENRYTFKTEDGESYADVFSRASDALYDLEKTHSNKKILIITHGAVTRSLELASHGARFDTMYEKTRDYKNFDNAEFRQIDFVPLPHNEQYELDLHRPYIDSVVLEKDGKVFTRVKEVMDVWFDSGAMPFAQDHYPFENKEYIDSVGYPADFISEAVDQTRGWFYTLHAIGALMGKGKAYKNVICLGHLLDAEGKKMSKSVGNIVEPYSQIDSFGVDAVRFWMYSVNQPGESKNYDPKSVAEINNKVFNLYGNVVAFYELYRDRGQEVVWSAVGHSEIHNVLDQWLLAKTNDLVATATTALDQYNMFAATRAIKDFMDDLSTWYLRRSRDRIKDGDSSAKEALYRSLKTVALVMAPFAPFTAETVWQQLRTEHDAESVHLADWPTVVGTPSEHMYQSLYEVMGQVRTVCTAGNALRKKIGIAVRQPLASITVGVSLAPEYQVLIQEELNVKAVLFDSALSAEQVLLDEVITESLQQEGSYRELVRVVQDMRKAQGLSPSDSIILTVTQDAYSTIADIEAFKKTVQAISVSVGPEIALEVK